MATLNQMVREFEAALKPHASAEIFNLASQHGLIDRYADVPGSRGGEYVGTVNGKQIACRVYDRDPDADLRALRAAISVEG